MVRVWDFPLDLAEAPAAVLVAVAAADSRLFCPLDLLLSEEAGPAAAD